MADPFSYAQQSDLEVALGGANVLEQLSDPTDTGLEQAAIIVDYLEAGAAEVRSAVEVKHDPEIIANLDPPSLRRLVDANAALSARIAWEKGGKGMAMPDWVKDRAERTDHFLDALARGERRLGRVAGGVSAAINQAPMGKIDPDTTSVTPVPSTISIAGFKAGGFR